MRRLTWHDNVPKTEANVHGWFSLDDLGWLQRMHPKGRITPTFSCVLRTYSANQERLEAVYAARAAASLPFYFRFPLDQQGELLLVALKIAGLGPKT